MTDQLDLSASAEWPSDSEDAAKPATTSDSDAAADDGQLQISAEELLNHYQAGERDFSGLDLRGIDLSTAKLTGINFSKANLSDANLSGTVLNGANLRDAILRNADLSWADLHSANLIGADLTGANIKMAIIIRTRFKDTTFPNGKKR